MTTPPPVHPIPGHSAAVGLVLAAIVSVQIGGALAATVIPILGAGPTVLLRLAFATFGLVLITGVSIRGHNRAGVRAAVVFGVTLGLMNWSFYAALAHLPIGVAVTCEFVGPLLLAAWLSRSLRDGFAVLGAAVGVVLISETLSTPLGNVPWVGIGLALLAGGFWAGYIVAARTVGQHYPGIKGLTYAMIIATVITAPVGAAQWATITWSHVGIVAGVALLSSLIPYSLELVALRRISPKVFGVLLSLEPAVAAVAGWLVLGQWLSWGQLLGMGCVVAASMAIMTRNPTT